MSVGALLIKSTFVRKLIAEAAKAGYARLLKEYDVYRFLEQFKVVKPTDNHDRLYLHTVVLLAAKGKEEEYIRLLLLTDTAKAFKDELVHRQGGAFAFELDHQLHTDSNIRDIKHWNEIPEADIRQVFNTYNKLVKDVAPPSAVQLMNGQQDLGDAMDARFNSLNARNEQMQQELLKSLDRLQGQQQNDELLKEYEQQITELTADLDKGFVLRALDKFEKLKTRIWHKINDQLRFRILTNIGVCHYQLHQNRESAEALIAAYHILPETEIAFSNIVNAYMSLDDGAATIKYLKLFLKKFPKSVNAHACRIKVYAAQHELEYLQNKTPKRLLKNPEIIASLGLAARSRNEYELAIHFLGIALEANPEDDFIEKHLLQAYLEKYAVNFKVLNLKILDDDTLEDLDTILRLIRRQQEKTNPSEKLADKVNLYLAEGFVLGLKKDTDRAIDALDRGLFLDPDNRYLLKQKGFAYALSGQVEAAIVELLKIKDYSYTPDVPSLMAECYRNSGRKEEGIKVLEAFLKEKTRAGSLHEHYKRQAIHILLDLYMLDNKRSKITQLRKTKFKNNTIFDQLSLSRIAHYLGESEEGKQHLLAAYGLVNDASTFQERFFLADDLQKHQFHAQSIALYQSIADPQVDSEPTRILYKLLWHFGRLEQALDILEQLRNKNGILEETTRYEIECYQQLTDYPKACQLAELYLKKFPENDEVRLILGGLYYRLNRTDEHRKLLQTPVYYLELHPSFFSTYLAQLSGLQQRDMAIAVVYEYQRIKGTDEAFLIYHNTVLMYPLNSQNWAECTTVENDSAVTLVMGNTTFTLILEERPSTELKAHEINPGNTHYQQILGKNIGDQVAYGMYNNWVISSVKSKFKHAFDYSRRAIETSNTAKPTFKYFNLEDVKQQLSDNPEQLQAVRHAQTESFINTFRPYQQRQISLFTLARNLNQNLILVREQLIAMPEVGIQCSEGQPEKVAELTDKLEGTNLCADLTGLLTIFELGLEDQVREKFGKIFIVPSTMDLVLEDLEGSKLFRPTNHNQNRLSIFKSFVDQYCEERLPSGLLQISIREKQHADQMIHRSISDTFLLASENRYCYLSDDFISRETYKRQYSLPVVFSFELAKYFYHTSMIDLNTFADCTIDLVVKNYASTPVESYTIYRALKQYQPVQVERLLKILSVLSGNSSQMQTGLILTFHYCLLIWRDHDIATNLKQNATQQAIAYFIFHRDPALALNHLQALLDGKFGLLINPADELIVPDIQASLDAVVVQLQKENLLKKDVKR